MYPCGHVQILWWKQQKIDWVDDLTDITLTYIFNLEQRSAVEKSNCQLTKAPSLRDREH